MINHGSALEWIQLLVGLGAGSITWFLWRIARHDYTQFGPRPAASGLQFASDAAQLVVEGNFVGETINLFMAGLSVIAGIVAVVTVPPPGEFTITALWKLIALIALSSLITLQGFRSLWYRRRILRLLPPSADEQEVLNAS
jgi:hypothetical protein